jgi:hypothetical protein
MNRSTSSKPFASTRRGVILMSIAALGLASTTALAQTLYRWVDDQGAVHYTDQVPPSHADKARTRLSEHGIAVETQAATPTGEELERAKELERQRVEEEQRRAERQTEDERLLKLYRTVEELELARDGRLAAVEAVIQAKRDGVRNESRNLVELYKEMRTLQNADKTVSIELMGKIEASTTRIRASYAEIVDNEYRKQSIQDEFAQTIERFRQLRRLPPPTESHEAIKPPVNGSTLVICQDKAPCHDYWERAVDYVRVHADPEGEILEPGLLMAFQRDERENRTLTISWTQKAADQPVQIYLDVQCKNRLTASLVCIDPRVPKVRAGFRAAVMGE